MPPPNRPVVIDDLIAATNQIQQQGLQPDTIIMHPDTWEQIIAEMGTDYFNPEDRRQRIDMVSTMPTAEEIVSAQPMTAATRLMFYTDYRFPDPPKDRWDWVLEELDATTS